MLDQIVLRCDHWLGLTFKQPKPKNTIQLQREWENEYLIGKIKGVSLRADSYREHLSIESE